MRVVRDEYQTVLNTQDPLEQARLATALITKYKERALLLAQVRQAAIREALDAGMTQQQVANALGLTKGRVSQILQWEPKA